MVKHRVYSVKWDGPLRVHQPHSEQSEAEKPRRTGVKGSPGSRSGTAQGKLAGGPEWEPQGARCYRTRGDGARRRWLCLPLRSVQKHEDLSRGAAGSVTGALMGWQDRPAEAPMDPEGLR